MWVEPDGAVLRDLEQVWVARVAAIGGVLDDEVSAGAMGGGEKSGCAARQLVGSSQLASVSGRDVGDAQNVVARAHRRWAAICALRFEEARDRVGTARWGGDDDGEVPAADSLM